MSDIKKVSNIRREALNEEFFLLSVLHEAADKKLISSKNFEKIRKQTAELLTNEIERYTVGESSSVRVEKAQEIFNSLSYTVGLYLKTFPDGDTAAVKLQKTALSELHLFGKHILSRKVAVAKLAYLRAIKNRIKTKNTAYNDTLRKGILIFFKAYDSSFGANETPASIDYPLCNEVFNFTGIEFMLKYLNALYLENLFCRRFSSDKIDLMLRGYHQNYEDLLINIFERVLTNALGCVILNKNIFGLTLTSADRDKLYSRFSNKKSEELAELLKSYTVSLIAKMNIQNPSLEEYILSAIIKISGDIKVAAEQNNLSSVFPSAGKLKEQTVYFEDGEKMKDEVLRKFIDELKSCRFISDKIKMIHTIKSMDDLLEVLRSESLYESEFIRLFSSLGEMELALLLKEIPADYKDIYLAEGEKLWMSEFISYFNELGEEKKDKIQNIVTKFAE